MKDTPARHPLECFLPLTWCLWIVSLSAGINAASMALADAGLLMKDLVASVSVGRVDDKIVVDLDYSEESYDGGPVADIPLAMIPKSGEVTLLQMDGLLSKEQLKEALEMGKKACDEIYEIQKKALKAKYVGGSNE